MSIADAFLAELEQEAKRTRRVLERVPEDKLAWKPHEKSMSLGELASHVATAPGGIARILAEDSYEIPGEFTPAQAKSRAELLEAFEGGLAAAREMLARFDDAAMARTWTVSRAGKVMTSMPRQGAIRFIMLNHTYHHRGQLAVYLRLLGVPVPALYGPSADENPFA